MKSYLQFITESSNSTSIHKLFDRNPDIGQTMFSQYLSDVDVVDSNGWSLGMKAIHYNNMDVFEYLLQNNINTDIKSNLGSTLESMLIKSINRDIEEKDYGFIITYIENSDDNIDENFLNKLDIKDLFVYASNNDINSSQLLDTILDYSPGSIKHIKKSEIEIPKEIQDKYGHLFDGDDIGLF